MTKQELRELRHLDCLADMRMVGKKLKEYQRKKHTKYILPRTVYHQTLWRIRDYYRLKEIAESMILSRTEEFGVNVQGGSVGDAVASAAIKRERFIDDINKIDCELGKIPKEYRRGVWNNIQFGNPYPLDADRATYGRYKSKFIYRVAERFDLI